LAHGDSVQLVLQGNIFELLVEEKSHSRNGMDSSFTARLISPASVLSDITTTSINTTQNASDIVDSLANGITVFWNIIDWQILAGKLNVQNESNISIINKIIESAGAVIQSNANGSLSVQYKFPTAVNEWENTALDFEYTGLSHQLSYSENYRSDETYNAVIVLDSEDAATDSTYNGEYADTAYKQGVFKLYAHPWNDYNNYVVDCSGHPSIVINTPVLTTESITEEVEFKNGTATTSYPVVTLDDSEWLYRDLGTIISELDSTTLSASTAGYSRASVTYTRRFYEYGIFFNFDTPKTTQFIILENE